MDSLSTNQDAKTHRIGEVLENAGLISNAQLQTALFDQEIYGDLKFGEILALRGWLSQATADFFAKYTKNELTLLESKRLGDYLIEANLLTPEQLLLILDEQQLNHMLFGSLAVLKGYINQKTLNFFLRYILNQSVDNRPFWKTTYQSKAIPSIEPKKETQTKAPPTEPENKPSEINWIG